MKKPTKSNLYEQIAVLERENLKLSKKVEEEERKKWLENKNKAVTVFFNSLPFPSRRVTKVTLEHIDKAGYWFTFEIDNDNRRQTYAVRHSDLPMYGL
jgi:hypothetical protein